MFVLDIMVNEDFQRIMGCCVGRYVSSMVLYGCWLWIGVRAVVVLNGIPWRRLATYEFCLSVLKNVRIK